MAKNELKVGLDLLGAAKDALIMSKAWIAFANTIQEEVEEVPELDEEATEILDGGPTAEEVREASKDALKNPADTYNGTTGGVPLPKTDLPDSDPTELDSEGTPWLKGIHTEAKSTMASGAWKFARNIDREAAAETIKAVKLSLSTPAAEEPTVAAPPPPVPVPAAEEPTVAAPPPPVPVPAAEEPTVAAPPPPVPVPEQAAGAQVNVPTGDEWTFPRIMKLITKANKGGEDKEAQAKIVTICQQFGYKSPVMLAPKSIPAETLEAVAAMIMEEFQISEEA